MSSWKISSALLLPIVGLAFGLRLWQIDHLPPGFHFDEAFEGLEAWRILTDPTYRPIFLLGNFGVPPLNAYANALTFALFEGFGGSAGPTAMRVTAACFGVLGVLAIYALAKELRYLTGRRAQLSAAFPLLAATVLAIMRWHIHFSRMGIEPIVVPFIWTGTVWLFLRGRRTGAWLSFAGSGICLAAGMYTYQGAWIIPFLMIPTVFWLFGMTWRAQTGDSTGDQRDARKEHKPSAESYRRLLWGALVTAGVALVLVAPLGWFIAHNLDLVLLRPAQLSIVGATASPADDSIGAAVWATAKMFGPFGQPGDLDPRRNVPGLPALSLWLALPFYLGLLLALQRIAQPAYAIPLLGLVGLLLPGVFSEYAPHFHRILGAAAPTALFCAVALDWLWQWRPRRQTVMRWGVIGLLLLGGVTESYTYFVTWARLPDLFYAFDVGLWQVGQAIAAQPPTTPIYLTPRTADHPTLTFAWTTRNPAPPAPVTFDGRHIFPLTAGRTTTAELYAVIEHEDFRTRLLLPGLLPTATVTHEFTDPQGDLYARFYQRPADTVIQRSPQHTLQATLGDGITLVGYDVQPDPLRAGAVLYLQIYWQVATAPTADWTVYTHLLQRDAQGNLELVAGHDSPPGAGSLPTAAWQAGWLVLDEYQLALPDDLPPGDYELAIGLYQPSGERLPTTEGGIALGKVYVE
ncbi:MAG: glycosyltransferase family 39 protein [Caldilineaceae bacterium]